MENSNLVSALRSLQASSAEMTKKQEEEDVKKQRYESEMEDSLHAISDYSEKKREIEMEIDSQEKVLRQPIATIEIEVIKKYLPAMLEGAELEAIIQQIVTETGATSAKDMGKVMGAANKALAGKAEGRAISEIVKRLLS